MTNIAKKNHFNPCFWTAHWNRKYFEAVRQKRDGLVARRQQVFVLNLKADNIYTQAVEHVHYDKHLCFAEVTMVAADKFCQRAFPNRYDDFKANLRAEDYPVYIDFESLFGGMERLRPYQVLLEVIRKNCITSYEHKIQLAHIIIYQRLRSHAIMQAVLEVGAEEGRQKFEALLMLKWALSSNKIMWPMIDQLSLSHWQLYRVDRDMFPLADLAVMMREGSIMVALSPRLLLEITPSTDELGCNHSYRIGDKKMAEFRERTINNTFREIIFSDKQVLEEWQVDPMFQNRIEVVRSAKDYNSIIESSALL